MSGVGAGNRGARRLKSLLRHKLRVAAAVGECRRLQRLRGAFSGKRVFLVANGPSLGLMDLAPLAGEEVALVNMGLKALDHALPSATIHISTDNNRYRRFAADYERYAAVHHIRHRFYGWRSRRVWRELPERSQRPHFLVSHPLDIEERGCSLDPCWGYSSGSTVLVFAAQLMLFLGFEEIIIIGCDLDYGGDAKYFYALEDKDLVHEADPLVVERRQDMILANRHLAIVREFVETQGSRIVNAGVGGNLEALPRVDYTDLFPRS